MHADSRLIAFVLAASLLAASLLAASPVAAAASIALAQPQPALTSAPPSASAAPLAFDVVTIKRDKSSVGPATIESPANGDSVTITHMSPRMILAFAYDIGLHDAIYGLPGWADSESYDITAKVAEADLPAYRQLLPRQRNPMLRSVLAVRFHLRIHTEPRQLPAYALVIAKGGPKLTAAEPAADSTGGIRIGHGVLTGEAAPIAPLLDALGTQLGRPVVDRTGLAGHYNFTLQFAPVQASTDAAADAGPSIFTAVEDQLGLKLESTKAPIPVLVVDHIDRPTQD